LAKTWHFGKITAFTAFDENHGFRDFHDYLLSLLIWSTHLLQGRPGRQFHWLLGGRPSDRLTWQSSSLWAGMAAWPCGRTGHLKEDLVGLYQNV